MAIKFIPKKKPAPLPPLVEQDGIEGPKTQALEDELVADAVPATTIKPARTNADSIKDWKNFVGPDAKPIACAHCGHFYYIPCKGDEYKGCQNFHAKNARAAANGKGQ